MDLKWIQEWESGKWYSKFEKEKLLLPPDYCEKVKLTDTINKFIFEKIISLSWT